MRLWHYRILEYLPDKQLKAQWRECVCIAKNIKEKITPNHILVNKIMDYPIEHFNLYCLLVSNEMIKRGYHISSNVICKLKEYTGFLEKSCLIYNVYDLWHDYTYYRICMANLYEKYLCGGISDLEWDKLLKGYFSTFNETYLI